MNSPDEKVLVERQSPYHYTQDGCELKECAEQALLPLFAQFMDRGYSPYQICAVVYDSVAETSRDIVSVHKTAEQLKITRHALRYRMLRLNISTGIDADEEAEAPLAKSSLS